MKTLQQAKDDYAEAIHNCKFFKGEGLHNDESKKFLAKAEFIKPAIIYLESDPSEAFINKMKEGSLKNLEVLAQTIPEPSGFPNDKQYRAAVTKHNAEKTRQNRHIKMIDYILETKTTEE